MVQLDETGHVEVVTPLCHWCEEPLDGAGENGMHGPCANEYRETAREAWLEQDAECD